MTDSINFLTEHQALDIAIQGSYDPFYVIVSVAIAIAASYAAFEHTSQLQQLRGAARRSLLLSVAALTMGGGIWAMHFVGMLAYALPVHMEYDTALTMLSIVPAVVCSAAGLWIISRHNVGIGLMLAGSVIMGGGIGSMHFMGMAAMRTDAELYYDPVIFALAVVVAVGLAFVAILTKVKLPHWVNGRTRAVAVTSAIVMGAAASGMHYVAMEAAYFIPIHDHPASVALTSQGNIAMLVGIGTALMLGLSIAASVAYRYIAMAKQLKESSDQLKTTIRELKFQEFALNQRAIVSIADVKGRITFVNSKFCEISGYAADELIGQTHQVVKSDEHPPEFFSNMWRDIANGKVWHGEIKNRCKDGKSYWVNSTIVPFLDESGKPFKYISIRTDITEHKRDQEALLQAKNEAEQANRTKSSFLATMSHEIRTPMNGIIGMTELLTKTPTNDEQKHMIGTVRDSAYALLHIINDILDFSKIEAGKLKIDKTSVYLPSLVENIVETLLPNADAKGVRIKLYINPGLCPWVLGDQVRIRQILINLIGNAIKFTESPESGQNEVTVTATQLPDRSDGRASILLSVTDTGIGMSEEVVSKLFKPFTQGEESTTRRFGGTGLGLSICKQLVDMMGGTIDVESEVGVGTTFNVMLPFELADTDKSHDFGFDISGVRILLAVEDPDTRDIAFNYLRNFDAEVKAISDPSGMAQGKTSDGWSADVIITCSNCMQKVRANAGSADGETGLLRDRFVVLTENAVDQRHAVDTDALYLNSTPLLGTSLRRTVAIAAGRASPEPRLGDGIDASAPLKKRPTIREAESSGRLILLAEDNEINQDLINRQLEILGYAVEIFSNGREALDAWHSGRFGLLLTDCHMPEMDGFELTAAIRTAETDSAHRIPIVAITANALAGEAKRCLDGGMDDFLSKPVELLNLKTTIKKWLPEKPESAARHEDIRESLAFGATPILDAPNGEEGPIDPTTLVKLIGDDPELHRKFLVKFIDPGKETIGQIFTAYSERSASDIGDLAHKLKSSARAIGANALADTCAALEAAGKDENWPRIDELAPEMDGLMGEVETYVLAI